MIKLACNSLIAVSKDSKDCMDVEKFLDLSYELRLDAVDFQLDRGIRSRDRTYLGHLKSECLKRGMPIGFLGIGSGFIGTDQLPGIGAIGIHLPREELRKRIDEAKKAVDDAAFLGAPLIRLFGDLSDGLQRQPSVIIVSAILGPTSPRLAHVDESRTPYFIYSPCSKFNTCLAKTSAVILLLYNSLYIQRLLSQSIANHKQQAKEEYPQSQARKRVQLRGISKGSTI